MTREPFPKEIQTWLDHYVIAGEDSDTLRQARKRLVVLLSMKPETVEAFFATQYHIC